MLHDGPVARSRRRRWQARQPVLLPGPLGGGGDPWAWMSPALIEEHGGAEALRSRRYGVSARPEFFFTGWVPAWGFIVDDAGPDARSDGPDLTPPDPCALPPL